MEHRRQTAIITGASQGIGAAVAEPLARDGLQIVVDYAGSADLADALVERLARAGGTARAVKADVSDPGAMRALFESAEQAFGGVDVRVNNAGIMRLSPLAEADDEAFDRTVAINLKGVFNGLREAGRGCATVAGS